MKNFEKTGQAAKDIKDAKEELPQREKTYQEQMNAAIKTAAENQTLIGRIKNALTGTTVEGQAAAARVDSEKAQLIARVAEGSLSRQEADQIRYDNLYSKPTLEVNDSTTTL